MKPASTRLVVLTEFQEAPTPVRTPRTATAWLPDDLVIIQAGEYPLDDDFGAIFLVHWNGAGFVTMRITDDSVEQLEHAVFGPLELPSTP